MEVIPASKHLVDAYWNSEYSQNFTEKSGEIFSLKKEVVYC